MKATETGIIVEGCFHGESASCTHNCPFGLDIRAFMEKAAKGKWVAAYKALRNAVVFPMIVSKLCSAPCRAECQRIDIGDEPLNLPLIEQAAVAFAKKKIPDKYVIPPKEQSAAVVGAGLSGLACALDLAQKRYIVTLYDKSDGWGGKLREHEDFPIFDEDIALQLSAVSIETRFGCEIKSLDELESYDAVYIATGRSGEGFGLQDSFDHEKYSTEKAGVFLGGGLCGEGFEGAIAMGTRAARHIAAFLQTGRVDAALTAKKDCSRHVEHIGVENSPPILPGSGDTYTEEEALLEAGRCMLCDCTACMTSCEMLAAFRKKPRKIATEVYTDTQVSSTFSTRTLTRQTYSCNMCSYCQSVCPEGINMRDLFSMSRRDRFKSGAAPYAMHDYWMREMEFNCGEASFIAAPNGTCEYVFYPGCQLGSYNPEHVLKSFELLKSKFDCGIYLGCCGAPAMWVGDDETLNKNVQDIRLAAQQLGNPTFILACATCQNLFDELAPELKYISLYEILASQTELDIAKKFSGVAVFDPCSARDYDVMSGAVRELIASSGTPVVELAEKNRCCGYGGLVRGGNPKIYELTTTARKNMSDLPYIVYCANCKEVFRCAKKDCVHVLDMVFDLPVSSELQTISERRSNSLFLKSELMKNLEGEVFMPQAKQWDELKLIIEPELAEQIDAKLICQDDMKEAIWRAQSDGSMFADESDDSLIASLVRNVLTYWVRYKALSDGEYEILDAYYHRMSYR